jgi:hypothetical protein
MSVGDRGMGTSEAICCWPGKSPSRLWSYFENTTVVDKGDRTAPGPDSLDWEHGCAQRKMADAALGRRKKGSLDDGNIGRGSSHVECQDTAGGELISDTACTPHASSGARESGADRLCCSIVDWNEATG